MIYTIIAGITKVSVWSGWNMVIGGIGIVITIVGVYFSVHIAREQQKQRLKEIQDKVAKDKESLDYASYAMHSFCDAIKGKYPRV